MKKTQFVFSLLVVSFGLSIIGCGSDGPTGDINKMIESRDKQMKGMADQRSKIGNPVLRGQTSAEAAAKAGNATH